MKKNIVTNKVYDQLFRAEVEKHLNEGSNKSLGFFFDKKNSLFSYALQNFMKMLDVTPMQLEDLLYLPKGEIQEYLENKKFPALDTQKELSDFFHLNEVQQEALKRKIIFSKKCFPDHEPNNTIPKNFDTAIQKAVYKAIESSNDFLEMLKVDWQEPSLYSLALTLSINEATLKACAKRNNFGSIVMNSLKEKYDLSNTSFVFLNFISNSQKQRPETQYSLDEPRLNYLPAKESYIRGLYDITKEYQKKLSDSDLNQKQKLAIGEKYFKEVVEYSGVIPNQMELLTGVSHMSVVNRSITNRVQKSHFSLTEKIMQTISGDIDWLSKMMIDTSFGLNKEYTYKDFIDSIGNGSITIGEGVFIARTQSRMTTWDFAEQCSCKPKLINQLEAGESFATRTDVVERLVKGTLGLFGKSNATAKKGANTLTIAFRGGENKSDQIKAKLEDAYKGKITSGEFVKFILETYKVGFEGMATLIEGRGFANPPTKGGLYKWSLNKAAAIRQQTYAFASSLEILNPEEVKKCCDVLQHKITRYDPSILPQLENGNISKREALDTLFKNSGKTKDEIEKNIGGSRRCFHVMQKHLSVPEELIDNIMNEFGIKDDVDKSLFKKHFSTELSLNDLRKSTVSAEATYIDRLRTDSPNSK